MANLFYALVPRRNPAKKDAPKLFYAASQKSGDLTFGEIKERIAHSTTATAGDVALVVESLIKVVGDALKEGKSVFLDRFGNFRLSISSKGSKTAKEFTREMIRGVRILFRPAKELKISKTGLTYEQKESVTEQRAAIRAKLKGTAPVTPATPGTGGGTKPEDKKDPATPPSEHIGG